MPAQLIRRSQFITTYGPGAILEGPDGPRVIFDLEHSEIFEDQNALNFEISDQRLSQSLLGGVRIIRIPSNADVGKADFKSIYKTKRFPTWSLCVPHGRLYKKTARNLIACPECGPHETSSGAWDQANKHAVRFVRACEDGHLDDVDWIGIISHSTQACRPASLRWSGGGGALRNVLIACPDCGSSASLGVAYGRDWRCSGRFPESDVQIPGCSRPARIIQRGAANLRMPELITSLTIPPRSTPLHRILERANIQVLLSARSDWTKALLVERLQGLVDQMHIRQNVVEEVKQYDENTILEAVQDTLSSTLPKSERELRLEEFQRLKECASKKISSPYVNAARPLQFEVMTDNISEIKGPGGQKLRISPVSRLRVVMVQTGYRRLDPLYTKVELSFHKNDYKWVPGVELLGEGIFIDLPPSSGENHSFQDSDSTLPWLEAWIEPKNFGHDDNINDPLHPVFVWWHSLSHRLINALSVHSGYSSSSIRERVFVRTNKDSWEASGGVLLYTAQPGGDGTLGGLAALATEFDYTLEVALAGIDVCSNDPLCEHEKFGVGKCNGPACYACLLISETSCEHRNMYLDRNLLRRNLP